MTPVAENRDGSFWRHSWTSEDGKLINLTS